MLCNILIHASEAGWQSAVTHTATGVVNATRKISFVAADPFLYATKPNKKLQAANDTVRFCFMSGIDAAGAVSAHLRY